jgi:hypothetical protein
MESLVYHYKQFPGNKADARTDFREIYKSLFLLMYELIQFSIDHIAGVNKPRELEGTQITGVRNFAGFDKEGLQNLLKNHF